MTKQQLITAANAIAEAMNAISVSVDSAPDKFPIDTYPPSMIAILDVLSAQWDACVLRLRSEYGATSDSLSATVLCPEY